MFEDWFDFDCRLHNIILSLRNVRSHKREQKLYSRGLAERGLEEEDENEQH